ncbi:MAG: M4 family metallopeptidase [Bacteroidota bacterium]
MKKLYIRIPLGILLLLGLFTASLAQQKPTLEQKAERTRQFNPESDEAFRSKWNIRKIRSAVNAQNKPKQFGIPTRKFEAASPIPTGEIRRITLDPKTRLPIAIRTRARLSARGRVTSMATASEFKDAYLSKLQNYIPNKEAKEEFDVKKFHTDRLGHTHLKLQQVFKGLPVWGSEAMIHIRPDGEELFNGRFTFTPQLTELSPRISPEDAIRRVEQDLPSQFPVIEIGPKQSERMRYAGPQAKLLIYADPLKPQEHFLAYEVEIRPNVKDHVFYMVNALTGDIITTMNHTCTFAHEIPEAALPPTNSSGTDLNGQAQNFSVFDVGQGFLMVDATKNMYRGDNTTLRNDDGLIITWDHANNLRTDDIQPVGSGSNQWGNTAVSAHVNASICYEYFESKFDHVSIDDRGRDMNSFINVPDPETGRAMDNAYWNGYGIYYGNGDRAFSALAGALDVAAHEMTHGVISSTANLVYQDEPGALNESFADVFGVLIENEDFRLGEEVVNTQFFPSGALRNVADPNQGGNNLNDPGYQPANVSEQFRGSQDNGGVHINSGIPNRAFANFILDEDVSQTQAEQVYYRALTEYLIRSSQFVDARLAVIRATEDLYGPEQVAAAERAFDEVGILDPNAGGEPTTDPFEELEENPGEDLIVLVNTANRASDPNRIYIYDPNAAGQGFPFTALSTSEPFNPISVSDDGRTLAWVDSADRQIRFIDDFGTPDQRPTAIETQRTWDNVALSRDGLRLAAVSTQIDTSIFVFNLETGDGLQYVLSNPTTAEGISAANVLFADALEWTFGGDFLMYDALNVVSNTDGFEESYWDIGFIQVWDTENGDFGDGTIIKLFTDIPEGTSVGNPVFAKKSPFIIAYDELVSNDPSTSVDDEHYIRTLNIETGDGLRIFENNIFGWPSYSPDDQQLTFTTYNVDEDRNEIGVLNLQADKLQAAGDPQFPVSEAKWSVWFATGERSLSVDIDDTLTNGKPFVLFPNPAGESISIQYELARKVEMDFGLYNHLGQRMRNLDSPADATPGFHQLEVDISQLSAGMYMVIWEVEGQREITKFVKR